jgi:hypothetical protein
MAQFYSIGRREMNVRTIKMNPMKKLLFILTAVVTLGACKGKPSEEAIGNAKQTTIDSINNINVVKQRAIDSVNTVKEREADRRVSAAQSSNSTTTTTTTTTEPKKKGWSSTAKGAVIGAGTGAVAGGIIGKNAKGAVIGGLVGAAAGAGTGAIIDAKKKKKAQQVQE